jgi:tripartite-type tricarboxylate transporter receptor subunit TctC
MQRAVMLPKGSPPDAVAALRQAFTAVGKDPDFITDYKRITGEAPDLVSAQEIEPLFERMRHVDPVLIRMVKESIGTE